MFTCMDQGNGAEEVVLLSGSDSVVYVGGVGTPFLLHGLLQSRRFTNFTAYDTRFYALCLILARTIMYSSSLCPSQALENYQIMNKKGEGATTLPGLRRLNQASGYYGFRQPGNVAHIPTEANMPNYRLTH